ncbi:MAG: AAA family ATPase [Candidatus Gracilibacteria bacterium]|nr:AAA family ATPase [Candidatus Gracilibacteria bacterium]
MKKLKVELKNCYGIKEMCEDFDFEKSNVYSIYAPNGTMKTSFLKGFRDYISLEGTKPCDKINNIEGSIILKDENDKIIDKEKIFPIESLNLEYHGNFSNLLINPKYQKEYLLIYENIEKQKKKLIFGINGLSKVEQSSIEKKILEDYGKEELNFLDFLNIEYGGIDFSNLNDYENVKYGIIFSKKAQDLLNDPELASNIGNYEAKYKEIINKYSCFRLGGFTIYQADNLLKEIRNTKFFTGTNNKLKLNIEKNGDISNDLEFDEFIKNIKSEISTNKDLLRLLLLISKGTKDVKEFQEHIETEGSKFVIKLNKQNELKKDLWNYYFKQNEKELNELKKLYNDGIKKLKEILEEAKNYKTDWYNTIKIFKNRFDVDFKIDIYDKENVVVGRDEARLKFIYNNNTKNQCEFDKNQLLQLDILSNGEKRVLYLIYIIFEFERRKKEGGNHLLVIDDIADSFDYKNKYAIIEYLHEIANLEDKTGNKIFKLIILTHNFDFYRNIQLRLLGNSLMKHCLFSFKNNDGIILETIEKMGIMNPLHNWKDTFHKAGNYSKVVGLIPFIRNLLDYSGEVAFEGISKQYDTLTSLLHFKENTMSVRMRDLEKIIQEVLVEKKDKTLDEYIENESDLVYDFILNNAKIVDKKTEYLMLEEKILLSISIRLIAEKLMLDKLFKIDKIQYKSVEISGVEFWKAITSDQTRILYDISKKLNLFEFKKYLDEEISEEQIMKQVLLMTPESIHLNSFMYEPILDMSDWHLKELYKKVKYLNENISN